MQKGREIVKRNRYVEQRWGTLRFVSGGLLVGDRVEEPDDHKELEFSPLEMIGSAIEVLTPLAPVRNEQTTEDLDSKRKKKSKRSKRREVDGEVQTEEASVATMTVISPGPDDEVQRRAEKAERKLRRKQRREARHQERSQVLAEHSGTTSASQALCAEPQAAIEIATPSALRSGIQTVRQRHIRQKRMAMMDSKALKEVS